MPRMPSEDKPLLVVRWAKQASLPSARASFTNEGSAAARTEASGRRHTASPSFICDATRFILLACACSCAHRCAVLAVEAGDVVFSHSGLQCCALEAEPGGCPAPSTDLPVSLLQRF